MLEYAIIIILLFVCCFLYFLLNRSINTIQRSENIINNIYEELNEMAGAIEIVLGHGVYSNDPVITNFIDRLKVIGEYIRQINNEYDFNDLGERNE
jgi:predicted PurR-regulated permease PerM